MLEKPEWSYSDYKKKLGDIALGAGQVFREVFPGIPTLLELDAALAQLYAMQGDLEEVIKGMGEMYKWKEEAEKQKKEHLT